MQFSSAGHKLIKSKDVKLTVFVYNTVYMHRKTMLTFLFFQYAGQVPLSCGN